jgi:hypothetical protein
MDALNITTYTTLINGKYVFEGSSLAFRPQSLNLPPPQQPKMPRMGMVPMMPMMQQQEYQMMMQPSYMMQQEMLEGGSGGSEALVQQASITLVGNKTKPSNTCCFSVTILLGAFFIIPLCFMCCMWWKKIVYPTYEVSIEAYQALADLIQRLPNLSQLNLTVVDSAFNAEKARMLHEALSRTRITGLNFTNRAL